MVFHIFAGRPEPGDTGEKYAALREKALEASYDEYKELTAAWRTLDTKAQGNVTIAGIFVAAAVAYLTKFERPGPGERFFLLFAILFLVTCIVLALVALFIRDVPPHYLGASLREMVEDLEGVTGEEFQAQLRYFYNLHAEQWESSRKRLSGANKVKGEYLLVSQVFLLLAIVSAAALVILKIFS
ncbi:MAG TPA: hypothetical protein VF591_13425 [Pyrinomonadaceae bacterium]